MIDFSKKYYFKLFKDLNNLKSQIMEEKFDASKKINIEWNTSDKSGVVQYAFKKLPRKIPDKLFIPFTNKDVEEYMKGDRIIAFTKIIVPAGQHVTPHCDNSYWGPEFFRVHIPLMNTKAYFTYDDKKIVWKKGKIYFFDVRNVKHSADNYSNKDFEFIAIDIKIENEK